MGATKRRRAIALATLGLLVAGACAEPRGYLNPAGSGLDNPRYVQLASGQEINAQGQIINSETGEVVSGPATGDTTDDTSSTTTGSSETTTGSTATGNSSSSTESGGSGSEGSTEEDGGPPTGGDSTGVDDDVIRIGIHAPITGAAPVPSDSAAKGARSYFQWMEHEGKSLFGRRVQVFLKNDQYNPSHAVAVCKEMVEQDKVFLILGAAGTDQIQACARYAASVGVPYLSNGVTEVGLTELPNYFATSMTYPAQQPLIADYLLGELGGRDESHAIVYANSSNFLDGKDAFVDAMSEEGIEVYQRAVSKSAGASDAQAVVTDLNQLGIENVNLLMPPLFWLEMLQASGAQNYRPQWIAAGVQMTFDTIATVGCRNGTIDGALAFAPFPAWFDSDKFDPDFREAIKTMYADEGTGGDDFMWLGWSGGKGIWAFLEMLGEDVTRERFIYFMERGRNLFNGIGPHLNFTPDDHFGADEVHVSEARCDDQRWHTIKTWVSDF